MKRLLISTILTLTLLISAHSALKAQSAQLIGGNMVNGAITGTALGIATMGLQDSNDFTPLRIGLGAGIIGGTGVAIYDISTLPRGQQFFISGLFNDGTNSSIIILLDTVYGAAVGAALGSAVMLVGNQSVLDGLQYGTSIGAWAGFGVGLIDSFILAEKNVDFVSDKFSDQSVLFHFEGGNQALSLIQPGIFQFTKVSKNALSIEAAPAVTFFSFRKTF